MVFYDTLFWSVLWHFVDEMCESEQMDFKNHHYVHLTSASPQLPSRAKHP